ncbi:hypothetical protein ACFE04_009657 [Oxalis oulophora]
MFACGFAKECWKRWACFVVNLESYMHVLLGTDGHQIEKIEGKHVLVVGHDGTIETCVLLHPKIAGAQWSCKVDATVFEAEEKVGFDFMIRCSNDEFLYAGLGTLQGRFNARVAEMLNIREVLLWIQILFLLLGLSFQIVISDCKEVVTIVAGNVDDISEFRNIVLECR